MFKIKGMKAHIVLAMMILPMMLMGCQPIITEPNDEVYVLQEPLNRFTMLYTDPEYGCQYIIHKWHGVAIHPRMDKDGNQVCIEVTDELLSG